jgi:hypothetical protein
VHAVPPVSSSSSTRNKYSPATKIPKTSRLIATQPARARSKERPVRAVEGEAVLREGSVSADCAAHPPVTVGLQEPAGYPACGAGRAGVVEDNLVGGVERLKPFLGGADA